MDFSFTDEQEAVAGLAAQIFEGRATVDRVKAVEATPERFDRELWAELAKANLLGIALPEEEGGSGLGVTELCLVLEQQGRRVAPVPLLWSQLAALAIAEHGTAAQRRAWLPGVIAGDAVLTVGLSESGAGDPLDPWVQATPTDDGWRLDGTKVAVPWAHVAGAVVMPVRDNRSGDVMVVLVGLDAAGVATQVAEATDRQLLTDVRFSGVPVSDADVLGGTGTARWLLERALTGLAAIQVGVAEEAVAMAAAYTSNRVQFGKPLSSFQSASARAADAYIDTEAMRATLWQAAWRLDGGLDASLEVEVAKWWASEGGERVVHATQHLHGGMGADIEYPVHRYFLWGKQIADTLGGSGAHLARIGRALAAEASR
ncbi:MAG TPA: acyl-CoA dehydrogenase family protein [Acidimicrobiales bacterium]